MIVLLSPEHFYLFNTHAAPLLTGYLKEKGVPVLQRMLDNEFYSYIASIETTQNSLKYIRENLDALNEEHIEFLADSIINTRIVSGKERDKKPIISDFIKSEKINSKLLHDAECSLKTKFFHLSKDQFLLSLARLQCALDLFTTPFRPARFSLFEGASFPLSAESSKAVYEATGKADHNFLIEYYRQKIIPTLPEETLIAGISITHGSQVIPALTLAREIKSARAGIHITLGGATVSLLRETFQKENLLWKFYDSVVIGAGEEPLARIYDELSSSHSNLNAVPQLTWKDADGKITESFAVSTFTIDQAATPVFTDPRPNPVLTIMTSIGCDWAKCRFCHFPRIYSEKASYQTRPVKNVLRDIETLTNRYAPTYFHICDTNVAVNHLEDIADAILKSSLNPLLYSFIRAEKQFSDPAFCEKIRKAGFFALHFGLESGSQRLLDRMRKGISLKVTDSILKNFSAASIIANIFLMIGSPTEKEEDIDNTVKYVKDHLPYISGEIAVSRYYLDKYSYIYHHPEEFGILIDVDPDLDLSSHVNFRNLEGPNQEDTDMLVNDFYRRIGIPRSYGYRFFLKILDTFCAKALEKD